MCINIISEFLVFIVLIKKNEVEIFISFKCLLISVLCEIRIRAWVSKRTLKLLVHFFSIARHWPYDGNVRRNCVHPAAAEGESSDAEINQPTIIVRFYFGQGEIWYSFHIYASLSDQKCQLDGENRPGKKKLAKNVGNLWRSDGKKKKENARFKVHPFALLEFLFE